jgi:hypothetical protein
VREADCFDHERTTVIQLKDYEDVLSGARPLERTSGGSDHHYRRPGGL